MRKVVVFVLLSMLFAGAVSAASLYGTYKGYPIIQLTTGGKEILAKGVPAINFNGSTMVPIYMLKELGISATWDSSTQTVDVSLDKNEKVDVISIARYVGPKGFSLVSMDSNGEDEVYLNFYYNSTIRDMPDAVLEEILLISALTESTVTRIVDAEKIELTILTKYARDYSDGKITADELIKKFNYNFIGNPQDQASSGNEVQEESMPNVAMCKAVNDSYDKMIGDLKAEFNKRGIAVFESTLKSIEDDRQNELDLYGCN